MKLTDRERDILACYELDPEIPITEMAKRTGFREKTIRQCLKRLRERGVINVYPLINLELLGYQSIQLFFTLVPQRVSVESEFIQELRQSPRVFAVILIGGDFQYRVFLAAKQFSDVSDFFNDMSEKFNNPIFEKQVSVLISWAFFGRKFLSQRFNPEAPIRSKKPDTLYSLDQTEHSILKLMAENPSMSFRSLSKELMIPHSTVALRVNKLKKIGVLKGMFCRLELDSVGIKTFIFLIFAKGISGKTKFCPIPILSETSQCCFDASLFRKLGL